MTHALNRLLVCLVLTLAVTPPLADAQLLLITERGGTRIGDSTALRQIRGWAIKGTELFTASIEPGDAQAMRAAIEHCTPAVTVLLREVSGEDLPVAIAHTPASAQLAAGVSERVAADLRDRGDDRAVTLRVDHDALNGLDPATVLLVVEMPATSVPVSERARIFRIVMHEVLRSMQAYEGSLDAMLERSPGILNVGLYDGGGTGSSGPRAISAILRDNAAVAFTYVGPAELYDDALAQFDVLIFPGGSGSRQARALGDRGTASVRKFVSDGGAYIGHCAGGYLASHGYPWSLGLINLKTIDREHWRRGSGDVQVELTDAGRAVLGEHETVTIRYANGPIFAPAEVADLPPYEVLGWYRSELAENGAPTGVMIDTPAIVSAPFGQGRVLIFSCHPEYTEGLESWVNAAVRWVRPRP
jgi:glutamine amidotransferase-like uncharacterized protein